MRHAHASARCSRVSSHDSEDVFCMEKRGTPDGVPRSACAQRRGTSASVSWLTSSTALRDQGIGWYSTFSHALMKSA